MNYKLKHFIKKLRMTEEKAQELKDDRVAFDVCKNWNYKDGAKAIKALEGYALRLSENRKEVYLVELEKALK